MTLPLRSFSAPASWQALGIGIILAASLTGCETTAPATKAPPPAPAVEAAPAAPPPPPRFAHGAAAPTRPVADAFFGTTLTDPYRYMEDLRDPAAAAWVRAQAKLTRDTLGRIPGRAGLLKRIRQLDDEAPNKFDLQLRGNRVFYLQQIAGGSGSRLMTRDTMASPERLLVDPDAAPPGQTLVLDWYRASPDGRYVAYGLVNDDAQAPTLRIRDVQSGSDLPVAIDRVDTPAEWHVDGKSLFYNQLAPAGLDGRLTQQSAKAMRHVLGTPVERDTPLLGHGLPNARELLPIDQPRIRVPEGSSWMLAEVKHGNAREISVYAAPLSQVTAPVWRRIATPADRIIQAEAAGDELYLLSEREAPRGRILQTSLARGTAAMARVAIAQGDHVLRSFVVAQDAIYLREMNAGVDLLHRVAVARGTISGRREFVRLPFDVAIEQMVGDMRRPGVIVRLQSWIDAPQFHAVDARTGALTSLKLIPPSKADYTDMDEVRQYAMARDGTRIPLTLLYRKGTTLNAYNPTLLTGYGANGVTQSPVYLATRLAWLERGGIYAICHVRGGGELGSEWIAAGRGARKENTVTDLIACADYLVQRRFTQPARLALEGQRGGGVPVGNAILRRPDLFAAAIPGMGVLDLLRLDSSATGAASAGEYGSAKGADDFRSLLAMSAYHQIKDDTRYPAVMASISLNERFTEPWMSAKYIARLQAASASGKPKLLRVRNEAGGLTTRAVAHEELADLYTFALWQMGEPGFSIPPG
jgi:prolyl oligopeptidase